MLYKFNIFFLYIYIYYYTVRVPSVHSEEKFNKYENITLKTKEKPILFVSTQKNVRHSSVKIQNCVRTISPASITFSFSFSLTNKHLKLNPLNLVISST